MYNIYTLENGLRVVAEKTDYVSSVCMGVWIKSGSRYENESSNGISHFIEHMLFKGTENRSAVDIVKNIEEVGGYINAFTGKEASCFYIKVLNNHEKIAVETLSDMMLNSSLKDEDIEKEKMVISEEINMNDDSPEDILSDLQSVATWGEGDLARTILGSKETIISFDKKGLKEYMEEKFVPENCVISICGNFSDDIYKHIEECFGAWTRGKGETKITDTPKKVNSNIFKLKDIEQVHVNLALEGVPSSTEDTYPLLLLANKLGGGASSRLFQKIREERGLCYSVGAFTTSYVNSGTLNVYGAMNPDVVQEFLDVATEEIDSFAKYSFERDELYKAKEQLKCSHIMALESVNAKMIFNGKSLLMDNRVKRPGDIIKGIEDITMDDLERVNHKVFKNGIINSAFVGAMKGDIDIKNLQVIE